VSPRSDMWLVSELAGPAVEHADECLGSGMLVADQDGVDFRHELARLAVYESIAPNRRLDLHRRALGALEDRPDGASDAAVLAHHAEAAGDGEAVLRCALEAAGRAATVGAHREAAAQYARALRFGAALPRVDCSISCPPVRVSSSTSDAGQTPQTLPNPSGVCRGRRRRRESTRSS
jgi:hypothetical protein